MHLLRNRCVHSILWPGWPQAAVHLPASDSMGKEGLGIAVCRVRWWVSSNSAMVPLFLCGIWTCGWVSVTWQRVREQPHRNWVHRPENLWLFMDRVQTQKFHLPNCSNDISAICKLLLWVCIVQSPVYMCPKKQLLAFFPTVISIYWWFIPPSAAEVGL